MTIQSEDVTSVDQQKDTSAKTVVQGITQLVSMYDDLVRNTVEYFITMEEDSPHFCRRLRITLAVLPTSLKYQHTYFLEYYSSQIAKATSVEELFRILNTYCNFMNCSLLVHILQKFGNEELRKQVTTYTDNLQAFRSRTKLADFLNASSCVKVPPEFIALNTKVSSEWKDWTLEDAEQYRKSMLVSSSLADYTLYLVRGCPG